MNSLSLGVLLQRLKNDVVVYTVYCTVYNVHVYSVHI